MEVFSKVLKDSFQKKGKTFLNLKKAPRNSQWLAQLEHGVGVDWLSQIRKGFNHHSHLQGSTGKGTALPIFSPPLEIEAHPPLAPSKDSHDIGEDQSIETLKKLGVAAQKRESFVVFFVWFLFSLFYLVSSFLSLLFYKKRRPGVFCVGVFGVFCRAKNKLSLFLTLSKTPQSYAKNNKSKTVKRKKKKVSLFSLGVGVFGVGVFCVFCYLFFTTSKTSSKKH